MQSMNDAYVVAIIPPDEKWKKMKAIWDSCSEAEIECPKEVWDFFGHETPDKDGVVIGGSRHTRTGDDRGKGHAPWLQEWRQDSSEGYENLLDKVPKDAKKIRVYMSW